ncbi:MAG: hypothetical protein QM426_08565 [Euryarchaeota archaeon]|nr:hypothetical protein [Euryarchaeota archaeon]
MDLEDTLLMLTGPVPVDLEKVKDKFEEREKAITLSTTKHLQVS